MDGSFLWVNGRYLERSQPALRADDRGLLYGDGFFDTLRLYGGVPFHLDRHLRRLARSCACFGIEVCLDEAEVRDILGELISRNGLVDASARITVTRGVHTGELGLPTSSTPTVVVQVRPLVTPTIEQYQQGLRLHVSSVRVDEGHPLAGHKSLNYMAFLAAREEARRQGVDEALVLDTGGRVAEAGTSNVFCVRGGQVQTPTLASGALPGITRETVLGICRSQDIPCAEVSLTLSDLAKSDEMFLTNSLVEIIPVAAVEKHPFTDPMPGPVTHALQGFFDELLQREVGR